MIKKDQLVKNLCRLSVELCSYNNIPCDCKFIKDSDEEICTPHENGSGCPELVTVAMLVDSLQETEYHKLLQSVNSKVLNYIKYIHDIKRKKVLKEILKKQNALIPSKNKKKTHNVKA